jgi:hypothetical protein
VGSGERGRKAHRAGGRPVDFNLDDFALDHLCLFFDPHADRATERLRERLRLVHLEREDLTGGDGREWRVRTQRLCHTHSDRRLAGARLPSNEDGAPGDRAVLDHLQDHASCLASASLPNHALRHHPSLEGIVKSKSADVRVRADPFDATHVLRRGHHGLHFCEERA